jgi:hypothetical protein
MMLSKIFAATVMAFGLSAGAASASTVFASAVTGFTMDGASSTSASLGGCSASSNRSNLCNALGAPDHPGGSSEFGFLSAGNYDALKFTFGGPITGPLNFFEITFNRDAGWVESIAFLLVGEGGATFMTAKNATPTGDVTNTGGTPDGKDRWILTADGFTGGPFSELWVFDTSTGSPGAGGGFDIDAISANLAPAVIPLPAAGFLLLAGLGGLAMAGRRRR